MTPYEWDGILRVSCLFPLSPLWFLPFNVLLWGHRTYQESWVHWVILGLILPQARSSPPLQGLHLGHISRGHTNWELYELFVWFLLPKLPSPPEYFVGGGEGKRHWEEKQITSARQRIMKRRGTLGRKDKSNSVIQFFFSLGSSFRWGACSKSWSSSLNITKVLRWGLLQETFMSKRFPLRRQVISWSWSFSHKCVLPMLLSGKRLEAQDGFERADGWWILLWDVVSCLCHLQRYWWDYCLSPLWILVSGDFK